MQQVTTNQVRVRSLRELIDTLTTDNKELSRSYNDLKSSVRTNDFDTLKRLGERNAELELLLERKEREINELMNNSKGSLNLITNLREKLKETEEENHKFNS